MVGSNQPTKETDYGREIDGKPLLIKGEPGTGKTMLAQVVAEALGKRGKHEKQGDFRPASGCRKSPADFFGSLHNVPLFRGGGFLFSGICGMIYTMIDQGKLVFSTKRNSKYRGILLILGAAFCFSCMSLCVRLAGDVPTMQKSFFRNLVAVLAALVVLLREGKGIRPADPKNWPLLLCRSLFGTIGLLGNFYAVDHLLLADASMLNKMSPFFAVIASCILLKEKLSPVQGASLVGAFAGALLIIKPTLSNMDLGPRWSDCWEDWAPALPIRWCGSWASGGNGGLLLYLCFQPFPAW